tara:strand:+ start:416 stop:1339 length:924 start_codon:yes stop_codon:yes gene_type:complete
MNKKIKVLQEIFGNSYNSKNEFLFFCPFCKHRKRKLSVNIGKSVFKCWVCDTKGGLTFLVRRFGSADNVHQWGLLNQEIDLSSVEMMFLEKSKEQEQAVALPKEYFCLARKNHPHSAKKPLAYLMSRGISNLDIGYYKIGYCETGKYKKRIIVPSFNEDGDCNYFSARTYRKDWLRYKNPPGSKNIIFNDLLVDWNNPITLVEGVFDAIKINNSIPILGSTLGENTKLFKKIASKQPKVFLGLDKDALSKSLQMIFSMLQYGIEVYFLDTSKINDIGSISKFEAEKLKKNSQLINTENIFNIYWRNQ